MNKQETLTAITFVMNMLDAENLQIPATQSANYLNARQWIQEEHNSVEALPDEDTGDDNPPSPLHGVDSPPAG